MPDQKYEELHMMEKAELTYLGWYDPNERMNILTVTIQHIQKCA